MMKLKLILTTAIALLLAATARIRHPQGWGRLLLGTATAAGLLAASRRGRSR
jgi:hypothetical protein